MSLHRPGNCGFTIPQLEELKSSIYNPRMSAMLDQRAVIWKKCNEFVVGMSEIVNNDGIRTIADMFSAAGIAKPGRANWDKIGLTLQDPATDFFIWAECNNWTLNTGLPAVDSFRLNVYVFNVYDRYKAQNTKSR
jgi:hypothetical protein